ncbi:helix-turn-helix domain-containing protein [Limnoglobus roseus]|uniref:XRE family transcriptional regulator n=1 Tax=Limnoglobus roseus TaxID=2598579 RepID=A0A5C1AMY6_9BACT|nr:helix-turn-helix transcriptional regulator [Limnoglobus roseus]QEL19935.1 XRE family transcriptional regulator [Limnoglobus roseus]
MFGSKLKELREAKGWSQKRLAEVTGLSQNGISHWENDERIPSWDAVLKLSKALGVECNVFGNLDDVELPADPLAVDPQKKRGRPKKNDAG